MEGLEDCEGKMAECRRAGTLGDGQPLMGAGPGSAGGGHIIYRFMDAARPTRLHPLWIECT